MTSSPGRSSPVKPAAASHAPTMMPSPPASPELRPRAAFALASPSLKDAGEDVDIEAANNDGVTPGISRRSTFNGLEMQTMGSRNAESEHDPLLLRDRLVDDDQIDSLRRRASGKKGGSKKAGKRVGAFYDDQNDHIRALLKPLSKHAEDAQEEEEAGRLPVKIAVYASLGCNVALAALQLYAAASSLSLSFFATASDSVFDPFANVALYWAHRKAVKADPLKYPGGGSRLESIGNIIYSFVMLSVSLILIVESIRALATHGGGETNEFHIPATVAVAVAFVTKFCLFLYCFSIRKMSSQVQVLWEDHRNDLLVNGFGIFTNAAGAKIAWFIDPLGAIIIALVLIGSWGWTAASHFKHLAGRSAGPDFLRLVTYKAMTFNNDITAIDSCKAYHSGPNYIVEVDIVMPGDTPLWKAHDVSQDLQDQLETLPNVDRAFVHVDHEVSHQPEHRKRI